MLAAPGTLPAKGGGRDMYLWAFILQFVLLLYTIVFYSSITAAQTETLTVQQQLANSQFSGKMLLAALAIIGLIVVERVAYLWRSAAMKLTLQAATVLAVHGAVFVWVPLSTNRTFASNPALIVFYLLWVAYFAVGALQLHHGYETRPPRESLKSNGFNPPMPIFFNIYLAIPFLYELRQILDWVCTPTSLVSCLWSRADACARLL